MKNLFLSVLILASFQSCTSTKGKVYTKEQFGEKWPFTVNKIDVYCKGASDVYFDADGKTYALNGKAKTNMDALDIAPIWKEDPNLPGTKIMLPSEFVFSALKECK